MAETFMGKHAPGTVFQYEGDWYVAEKNYQVRARDAFDAEDVHDVHLEVGWYTRAHRATSEQDLALVTAHRAETARQRREYHAKWDAINARLAQEQESKEVAKRAQFRARMLRDFPIGTRVQNRYIPELVGVVVAHHATDPKLSIRWDGQEHPAYHAGTTTIAWFGIFDQQAIF